MNPRNTAKVVVRGTNTLVKEYFTLAAAEKSAEERNQRAFQMHIEARYEAKALYEEAA